MKNSSSLAVFLLGLRSLEIFLIECHFSLSIFMLVYSAGLWVSEIVKLRVEDIDSNRNLIHIKGAKGKRIDIRFFLQLHWEN